MGEAKELAARAHHALEGMLEGNQAVLLTEACQVSGIQRLCCGCCQEVSACAEAAVAKQERGCHQEANKRKGSFAAPIPPTLYARNAWQAQEAQTPSYQTRRRGLDELCLSVLSVFLAQAWRASADRMWPLPLRSWRSGGRTLRATP
eukprot:scaffold44011_cov17-Tisochrysis_lutea.AAC.1